MAAILSWRVAALCAAAGIAAAGHGVGELAAAKREADALEARLVERRAGRYASVGLRPAPVESGEPVIAEANERLRMAVLDMGRRRGVQPGMKYAVMRGDEFVCGVEVVDAREWIAGAVVMKSGGDVFPRKGDRLTRIAGTGM